MIDLDAVGTCLADTLRPTEYLLDHGVRLKSARGKPFWLYRLDPDGEGFAYGEDRRKALAFTKSMAEDVAASIGKDWEAGRL